MSLPPNVVPIRRGDNASVEQILALFRTAEQPAAQISAQHADENSPEELLLQAISAYEVLRGQTRTLRFLSEQIFTLSILVDVARKADMAIRT